MLRVTKLDRRTGRPVLVAEAFDWAGAELAVSVDRSETRTPVQGDAEEYVISGVPEHDPHTIAAVAADWA